MVGRGQCEWCARQTGPATCEAFPDGIPAFIMAGRFNHHYPWPGGDKGLRFKALPVDLQEIAPKTAAWLAEEFPPAEEGKTGWKGPVVVQESAPDSEDA